METVQFQSRSSSSTHYQYSDAVKILLSRSDDKVCSKHPVLVEQNASFVINLTKLDHSDDIKVVTGFTMGQRI